MARIAGRAGAHVRRLRPRRFVVVLVVLAMAVPVVAVGARAAQYRLDRIRIIYERRVAVPPVASTLPGAVEVSYATADGLVLKGWYLAAPGASTVALIFHGTGATRATMAPLASRLRNAGISSFLAEYRGAADSPGTPSERGLARDADAALAEATARSGLGDGDVVVVGHSLGSAVTVGLAGRRRLRGVVLLAPFTNLLDVTSSVTNRVFAWLAAGPDRFDIEGSIAEIGEPLVIVRTNGDQVVPNAESDRVMAAAREPKSDVMLDSGFGHADPRFVSGPEVAAAVLSVAGER